MENSFDNNIGVLLNILEFYSLGVERDRLRKEVLWNCKNERKNSQSRNGYDIYKKRSPNIDEVIKLALQEGYIDIIDDEATKKHGLLRLSIKGSNYLKEFLTQNNSKAYEEFQVKVNELMKIHEKPRLSQLVVMRLFWKGFSPEQAIKHYKSWNNISQLSRDYKLFVLEKQGYSRESLENKYILNLTPKLFVPVDLMGRNVSLRIEGVETPQNLVIGNPYPNKRYHIAGLKWGKDRSYIGFFPIIHEKENFPEELSLKLVWTIEDSLKIIHHLKLRFNFSEDGGSFFSTQQETTRSVEFDTFDIVTWVEKSFARGQASYIYQKRQRKVFQEDIFQEITLTNLPLELHLASSPDRYFSKFSEKWFGERE